MQSSPSQTYHSNRTTNHSSVTYRPWEPDRDVTECRQCQRPFHFLLRRHHCRSCGQVVCDRCSSHRLRLLPTTMVEDPSVPVVLYPVIAQQPQRVCSACFLLAQHRGVAMKKSSSRQSRMVECPMCGVSLLHYPLAEQEHHVADCLNRGSPPVHRPRYLDGVFSFLSIVSPCALYSAPTLQDISTIER
ncbi:FYVE zinc finger-domain-containing protein [Spinellus fusiger]|nr:FYVE zinc finger-domain-containing protein [Spinellus fusiger]